MTAHQPRNSQPRSRKHFRWRTDSRNKNIDNPDVWTAIQHLHRAIAAGGVDPKLLALLHLRISQVNGYSACAYAGVAGGRGR
ncbi:hypothetical protein LV779_31045 [Streptomyces thinghirensis]|nr:hypothetical protein [Streptomyces thinghirensis]